MIPIGSSSGRTFLVSDLSPRYDGANMRKSLKKIIRYLFYTIGSVCVVEMVLVLISECKIGYSAPYLLVGTAFLIAGVVIIALASKYIR